MTELAAAARTRSQSEVAYDMLKAMTINFDLKPGQRLNEIELSKQLNLSRTPLREALNRLASERLLDYRAAKGFFCRGLDRHEVADLYELRVVLEVAAVRHACERASDEALSHFGKTFDDSLRKSEGLPNEEILEIDEAFHLTLARLGGNAELVSALANINERIRFIRLVDLEGRVGCLDDDHASMVERIVKRDTAGAEELMHAHVTKRSDEILAAIKEGLAKIYLKGV